MASNVETPVKPGRGGARPGSGPKPKPREDAPPAPRPARPRTQEEPTEEQWKTLEFAAHTVSFVVSDYAASKLGETWPNTNEWRQRRADATAKLFRKYGATLARHSEEFIFLVVWLSPLVYGRLGIPGGKQKLSMPWLSNGKPVPTTEQPAEEAKPDGTP